MNFKDKVVIVTGASSGIGAAAAKAFSSEGAKVVLIGRNEEKLMTIAKQCNEPLIIRIDISEDEAAKHIIDKTIEKFGQLDVLINNAGTTSHASLLKDDIVKAYDDVMRVNVRAVINMTKLAAPHLIRSKGNIINISSAAGHYVPPIKSMMAYSLSKAALNQFGAYAALELSALGVRVNTISPGPVRSDFLENCSSPYTWEMFEEKTALKRVSEPEEIADLILFLASDKAKGITGSNYISDNGILLQR